MKIGSRLVLKKCESDNSVEWISVGVDGCGLPSRGALASALRALSDDPTAEVLVVEVKARLTAKIDPRWEGRP